MNNMIFLLFISSITLFSCKREKESIGPEFVTASPNFRVAADSFEFNFDNSDFQTASASNWFKAAFNERVSWEIKISGTQSKAYKILSGISDGLNQANSTWYGTHTNPYFFIEGETVMAELSVLGSDKKWVDSSVIVKEIIDYGPDALLWWDMTSYPQGRGVTGISYWYSYFARDEDSVAHWKTSWDQRKLSPSKIIDPVQGMYCSLAGTNKSGSNAWWAGIGMGDLPGAGVGFPGASWNEVYLNFYIRRRTAITPSMGISIKSISGKKFVRVTVHPVSKKVDSIFSNVYTTISTTVLFSNTSSLGGSELLTVPKGYVKPPEGGTEGWRLVSIKLSEMETLPEEEGNPVFDPAKIVQITGSLGVAESTGFDMDFIVFTRGVPFNKIK